MVDLFCLFVFFCLFCLSNLNQSPVMVDLFCLFCIFFCLFCLFFVISIVCFFFVFFCLFVFFGFFGFFVVRFLQLSSNLRIYSYTNTNREMTALRRGPSNLHTQRRQSPGLRSFPAAAANKQIPPNYPSLHQAPTERCSKTTRSDAKHGERTDHAQ